jgi:exonuclease SbcC
MIVRRLTLNNFRRFKKLDLADIPLGLTGIIGRNGSGKSTLLEAIGWALYGTHALTTKTGKEGVKMQDSESDAVCEVVLEFEMSGDTYKVVRSLKGKAAIAHAFVYKNGSDDAAAEREDGVNRYMEKLFGMDRTTFFASVFAQQKELDMLTTQTPAKRQQIIRRLLRIDLIDAAITAIRKDGRQKAETVGTMKGMILDVDAVKAEIEALDVLKKSQIEKRKKEEEKAEQLKEDLKAAKAVKQEIDTKRKADQVIEKTLVRLEKEIQNASKLRKDREGELEELAEEKKELGKIASKEKEYISAKESLEALEKIRGLYEEKKGLEKELAERLADQARVVKAKESLAGKLAAYKDLEDRKEKASVEFRESRSLLQKIAKEINALEAKAQACRDALEGLSEQKRQATKLGPKSKCPSCFRELGASFEKILEHFAGEEAKHEKSIREYAGAIAGSKAAEAKAEKRHGVAEDALEKIREEEKKEAGFRSQLETNENSLKSIAESISRKKKRIEAIGELDFSEEKYELLKKKVKELFAVYERIMELKTRTARIPALAAEIKGLDKSLESLADDKKTSAKERDGIGFSEKELTAADKKYESLQSRAHEQDLEVKEIKFEIERIGDQIAQKQRSLTEQKELHAKMKAADDEAKRLEVLADVMDKFRQDLASRIRPMLVAHTSQLVAQTTGGKYDAIDLDEEYNLYVYDGTQRHLIKRFSGGEQDLISLCLRIAISRVISEQNGGSGVNFIALDEIFGSQDAVRKESILQALNSLSGQFQQIFLITHHEDLKDSMQNVLAVEEAGDGVSEADFVS